MTTVENVEAVIKLITNCYCNKKRVKYLKQAVIKEKGKTKESDENLDSTKKYLLKPKSNDIESVTSNAIIPREENSIQYTTYNKTTKDFIKLHEICIFPIKSCAPLRVDTSWPVNQRGLKFDREWMIVRSSGIAMTQKSDTKLCLIRPSIDEAKNTLTLSFPYAQSIEIPLKRNIDDNKTISSLCQSKICGDRIDGIDCGDEVADWLSDVLCTSGLRLIQQTEDDKRTMKSSNNSEKAISLSNQAQFLLINVASVDWLTRKVNDWYELDDCSEKMLQNTIDRFRANLIVESMTPLEEMEWKSIRIGDVTLSVTGPCTRCQMICIDQSTGEKTTEPLQTISREFQGKMRFGIYLCQCDAEQTNDDVERIISCGDGIIVGK